MKEISKFVCLLALMFLCACSSDDTEEASREVYSGEFLYAEPSQATTPDAFFGNEVFNILNPDISVTGEKEVYKGNDGYKRKDYVRLSIVDETNAELSVSWKIERKAKYQKADVKKLTFKEGEYQQGISVKSDGIYLNGEKKYALDNFSMEQLAAKGEVYYKDESEDKTVVATGIVPDDRSMFALRKDEYSFQCRFVSDRRMEVQQIEPNVLESWDIDRE